MASREQTKQNHNRSINIPFMRPLLGRIHHQLAKSVPAVKLCLLLRNQANAVIGRYLGPSSQAKLNGEALIAAELAPQTKTFVDVGANSGDWATMWLAHSPADCRGILFEPSTKAFARLSTRFRSEPRLALFKKGLAERPGIMSLTYHVDFDEQSTLVDVYQRNSRDTLEDVEVTTIDVAARECGVETIDFLKIDAEGFDERVLRGATLYLQENRIKALQFEYGGIWADADSTLTATLRFLENCHYDTFLLRAEGIYEFNIRKFGEFFHYANFLAVRQESREAVEGLIKPARF